jgi:glutamyl/glutaminyl-tRNA synthetase
LRRPRPASSIPVRLFTAIIAYTFAKQTGGVYFFRLEDTDQKREIAGTGLDLVKQLARFGIVADEGYYGDHEKGDYGPYVQSERADIYKIVIKELIRKGRAYPCFCTKEDLDQLRLGPGSQQGGPGLLWRIRQMPSSSPSMRIFRRFKSRKAVCHPLQEPWQPSQSHQGPR